MAACDRLVIDMPQNVRFPTVGAARPQMKRFIQTDKVRELMLSHAVAMLTQSANDSRFMMMPLGLLTGPNGILAALRDKGIAVAPRA